MFCLLLITSLSYANNTIRFGVSSYYPPYVFNKASTTTNGIDFDIAQEICATLKAQCTFVQMPLGDLYANLNQNKIDAVIGAIVITPEKKNLFTFTIPYLKTTGNVIVTAKSNINIAPNSLEGKKIGVLKDSVFYSYAFSKFSHSKIVTFNSVEPLMNALLNGNLDLVILDKLAANYWVNFNKGQYAILGSAFAIPGNEGFGIAVKRGNTALAEQLSNAISAMQSTGKIGRTVSTYLEQK
jgi:arginine transport system substrate-binding protein